jgi:hypothetical protein
MKRAIVFFAILALLSATSACTPHHTRGAAAGGVVGGAAGALLDSKNSWRGFVIGSALGALMGATLTDVSLKASQEAVEYGKPVEYRTTDGRGVYRSEPVDYNAQTKCHKVHEKAWEDGRLVKDQIREVCESEKTEPRY